MIITRSFLLKSIALVYVSIPYHPVIEMFAFLIFLIFAQPFILMCTIRFINGRPYFTVYKVHCTFARA